MQVRVKTPLIRVEIDGEIPQDLLEVVKRDFPEEVKILEGDEEYVDYFETDFHMETAAGMTPGDIVRIYRENRRWTQADLGRKIGGVAKQNVSQIERGIRRITGHMAIRLARVFNVPISRFITG